MLLLVTRTLAFNRGSSLSKYRLPVTTSLNMFQSKKQANEQQKVGDVLVDVSLLKDLVLNDVNGTKKKLGSAMGNGKSVVVFLRHLG
jgi:hypothetical protein